MSLRTPAIHTPQLPQHIQLPRNLQESSFGCSPPQPIQLPIWNITSNKTTYLDIPQEVHNVLIEFDYEIRHWSNVKWVGGSDSEDEEGGGGWLGNLFGGRRLVDAEAANGTAESTGNILRDLEIAMVSSIWNAALEDGNMTWDESGECAGLTIGDEGEAPTNDDANAEFVAPNLETKLLGLSVYPADEVNPDGCVNRNDQCTAIHGKISAAYGGTDEFGVSNYVISQLAAGMETGAFISEGSPALAIDFRTASDTSGGENSGVVVPIQTDRGTIWEQKETDTEDNPISKYGKLFVGLLVVLSVGFLISTAFKRRKMKRRMEREAEVGQDHHDTNGLELREEPETEREDSLPMKEVASYDDEEQSRAGEGKSVTSGWSGWLGGMFHKESTLSATEPPRAQEQEKSTAPDSVIEQVALEVLHKCSSDEIEVNLSGKKGWFSK